MGIPGDVLKIIETDLPADGRIHVQKKGQLDPSKADLWCYHKTEVSADLRELAPALYPPGVNDLENVEISGSLSDVTMCGNDTNNLISAWLIINNREGDPYKLILAVWQGDPSRGGAVWVGGVERVGVLPDLPPSVDKMPSKGGASGAEIEANRDRAKVTWNVAKDASAASNLLAVEFLGALQ